MKTTDIIKTIMKNRHLTQMSLAEMLGVAQASISAKLNRNARIGSIVEIAQVLGCEVVLKDLTTGEEYRITE